MRLHEALSDGLLDISEYNTMWSQYSKRVADANAALAELKEQRAGLEDGADLDRAWIGQFLKYRNITELSRETVITLIDKIFVHEDKRLHLNFNFHDELADFIALTKNALRRWADMARKSKYVKESGQEVNVLSVTFRVGLYLRLSVVDGDDVEYNSIGNQEKICVNFLKGKADSQVVQVYTDNGFTGMNYKRPGFQEMFADLQSGKINCVIVKDISRLGRNYILTSDLIERTFPEMGVRLICVNDTFDSFDPKADRESILMPLN